MMTVLLFAAFTGVLLAFGYCVARVFLQERQATAVYGMTAVMGPAVFIVCTNALAYLLPLFSAALAVLVLMLITIVLCVFSQKSADLVPVPRMVLWATCLLIAIAGFTFMRIPPSDVLHWSQAPMIATIVEGNFPVMQPTNPAHTAKYHYGPELLVASAHLLTGSSIEMGYGVQPLLGIAGILFFVLSLIYMLTASWRTALIASILALAGGGLAWIHIGFVRDVYSHFVLGDASIAPFRALWEMYKTPAANPLLVIGMHRSSAMGFPLFYALLYTLYRSVRHEDRLHRWRWMLASLFLALGLTLTMEIGFGVICLAMPVYLCVQMIAHKCNETEEWIPILTTGLMVLLPALLIALVQGGMLTLIGPGESLGTFHLAFTGSIHPTFGTPISLFSWTVIGSFGLTLILLPFALVHLSKKHVPSWFWLIALCGFVQFAVPVISQFSPRPGESIRLWWGATSIFGLIAGVYISSALLDRTKSVSRYIGQTLIVCMLVSSSIFLGMNLIFPTRHIEAAPIFARLPQMTAEEQEFYTWIKSNTSLTDYFYTIATNDGDDSFEQGLFIQRSGRFSVGHTLGDTLPEDDPSLKAIAEACDPAGFSALSIRYLAVTTQARAAWFRETCDAQQWNIVYDGGADSLRVYEVMSR